MNLGLKARTLWSLAAVLSLTVGLSALRGQTAPGDGETEAAPQELLVRSGMTLAEFGQENGLERSVLRDAFDLTDAAQLGRPLADLSLSPSELEARVSRARALQDEGASKDWVRIRIKFILWVVVLAVVLILVRRRMVNSRVRVMLYALSVAVFGVTLGSDPSPMGTVKDAVVLYGAVGAVFRPRAVALLAFLLMVVLANKFICGWGCQFGVLQDLIFRLRTGARGTPAPWKPPFALTNSVRILFFLAMVLFALVWAFDIVDAVDPFKIYKPAAVTTAGAVVLAALVTGSLFVYRPWCHLFCPFGLVGWVVEKVSVLRIKVDYDLCIGCEACVRACPSTVMGAILKRGRVIPDCFACGSCIEVCPADAVRLRAGRRSCPPDGKFEEGRRR